MNITPHLFRLAGLLGVIGMPAGLVAAAETGRPPATTRPVAWIDQHFPIIAWNLVSPEHLKADTPGLFELMRDAGINVAGFVPPERLDEVNRAGLKAIVLEGSIASLPQASATPQKIREIIKSTVAKTMNHPATIGYYLVDEPSAKGAPALAVAVAAVEEFAPGKWPYLSFLPCYASPEQLGAPDFAAYVDRMYGEAGAWVFTDSFYWHTLADKPALDAYWNDLGIRREQSRKHGRPVYHTVLSVPHFRYREVTEAELRWQVFTGLTFGAKGLQYFTFCAPFTGNYRLAPIDQFGHKTEQYDRVRRLNLMVEKMAPTLLALTSTAVYFIGDVPVGQKGVEPRSWITGFEDNFNGLVGEFVDPKGEKYVMITNLDRVKSERVAPTYLTKPSAVLMLCPYRGIWLPFAGEQMWLAPGQGVLLNLQR